MARPGLMMARSSKQHKEIKNMEALEGIFTRADKTGEGSITADDWFEAIASSGVNADRERMNEWFQKRDTDLDGRLTWNELMGFKTQNEVAFEVFDRNKDGRISKKEFLHICKNMTPKQIDAVMKRFGTEKGGQLNYEDFCEMMNHRERKVEGKGGHSGHAEKNNESSKHKYQVP